MKKRKASKEMDEQREEMLTEVEITNKRRKMDRYREGRCIAQDQHIWRMVAKNYGPKALERPVSTLTPQRSKF